MDSIGVPSSDRVREVVYEVINEQRTFSGLDTFEANKW